MKFDLVNLGTSEEIVHVNSTGEMKCAVKLDKINSYQTKNLLRDVLVLYVMKNVDKPMSDLIVELFEIEFEAGQILAELIRERRNGEPAIRVTGVLANVLSLISFSPQDPSEKT